MLLEKNIKVNLEVLLVSENLRTGSLKSDMEIQIDNPAVYVTVNRIPFFRAKLKSEGGLNLCRITGILDTDESLQTKEKYLI